MRSFADPDTHYELIEGENGKPTGEVRCLGNHEEGGWDDGEVCGRVAAAPEWIPHRDGCDQADAYSQWWANTHPKLKQRMD